MTRLGKLVASRSARCRFDVDAEQASGVEPEDFAFDLVGEGREPVAVDEVLRHLKLPERFFEVAGVQHQPADRPEDPIRGLSQHQRADDFGEFAWRFEQEAGRPLGANRDVRMPLQKRDRLLHESPAAMYDLEIQVRESSRCCSDLNRGVGLDRYWPHDDGLVDRNRLQTVFPNLLEDWIEEISLVHAERAKLTRHDIMRIEFDSVDVVLLHEFVHPIESTGLVRRNAAINEDAPRPSLAHLLTHPEGRASILEVPVERQFMIKDRIGPTLAEDNLAGDLWIADFGVEGLDVVQQIWAIRR